MQGRRVKGGVATERQREAVRIYLRDFGIRCLNGAADVNG